MSYTPYKRADIPDQWDTIIIGSGIGGLGLASLLCQHSNQKVLVLEQHYTVGGYTHVFKRPGFEWDVGVHYIGDVAEGTVLRQVFDEVSGNAIKWADMGEIYDTIVIDGKTYPFPKGRENLRAKLKEWFPGEEDAIDQYFALVREAVGTSLGYHANKALPKLLATVTGPFMRRKFLNFSNQTVREVLESLTQNQQLIAVLTGQFGDYGLPPAQASFIMHALLVNHYFEGGYYPIGGSGVIPESITSVIEQHGGKVLVNAEVDHILVEDNRAVGVQMARDGRQLRAKNIVSGAGVQLTINKLLPQKVAQKYGFVDKLRHVEKSAAHVCLYIGLNKTAEQLELPTQNYWIYPNADHEGNFEALTQNFDPKAELPVVYISFPGAKDPTYSERHPGKSAIDIITVAPYEWFEQWEETRWKKRGDDYEALKEEIAQKMLAKLYEYAPQTKDAIEHYELSTPLTTKHFCAYDRGELYGIDHTPERFRQNWLRPQTPLKGLYLTGQDICTAGVGGALFGGVLAASAILRSNMIAEILSKKQR